MTDPVAADLVIVARVVGLVDQSPSAQTRRTREVHTVLVEQTLQGCDESALTLVVRPNGEDWEIGRSYVLFLKRPGLRLLEAIPGTSRPASSAP